MPIPFPHHKAVAMTAPSSRRSFLKIFSATAAAPLLGQFLDVESAFGEELEEISMAVTKGGG